MADVTFSLVIPTISRPTLARALASLEKQDWRPGDEVIVVGDGPQPQARAMWAQFADAGLRGRYIEYPGPAHGAWGHHARNWLLDTNQLHGSHLMALDDDDESSEGAIGFVRSAVVARPDRPHIFRMKGSPIREILWEDTEVREANVGNPMFVCPNDPSRLGRWGTSTYEGDYQFIRQTCDMYRAGPLWHQRVICKVRPKCS